MNGEALSGNGPDGGPAFPNLHGNNCGPRDASKNGMSLRDYFAGQAMILVHERGDMMLVDELAHWAYEVADAMIKARSGSVL